LPGILLELAFEPLKQGDRVGGRPGKPGDDPTPTEPPDLLGIGFDDRLAHRHLTVAGDNDLAALAQRQDRRAVPGALLGGSGHALHVRSDNARSSAAESLAPAIRERGLPFSRSVQAVEAGVVLPGDLMVHPWRERGA